MRHQSSWPWPFHINTPMTLNACPLFSRHHGYHGQLPAPPLHLPVASPRCRDLNIQRFCGSTPSFEALRHYPWLPRTPDAQELGTYHACLLLHVDATCVIACDTPHQRVNKGVDVILLKGAICHGVDLEWVLPGWASVLTILGLAPKPDPSISGPQFHRYWKIFHSTNNNY